MNRRGFILTSMGLAAATALPLKLLAAPKHKDSAWLFDEYLDDLPGGLKWDNDTLYNLDWQRYEIISTTSLERYGYPAHDRFQVSFYVTERAIQDSYYGDALLKSFAEKREQSAIKYVARRGLR